MKAIRFFFGMELIDQIIFLATRPLVIFLFVYFGWYKTTGWFNGYDSSLVFGSTLIVALLIYYLELVTLGSRRTYKVPESKNTKDILWKLSLALCGTSADTEENDDIVVGQGTSKFPTLFFIARNEEVKGEIVVGLEPSAPFPFSLVGWYIHQIKIEKYLREQGVYDA